MSELPPPIPRGQRPVDDPAFKQRIEELVRDAGAEPASTNGRLIADLIETSLKLITDRRETGEIKLLTNSFKEVRHAYRVFGEYTEPHKVSIFGSARTPPDNLDYQMAVEFAREISERGWLCITGAGDGIMRAGHEGSGRASSFGLAIRLPFETSANEVIIGDKKLINFRYFFTRKLMFVSQCEAVAVFPGGFGTFDELFESLTLVQTGKSAMVPIVLVEHPEGTFWKHWENYVRYSLLEQGMISPEDMGLFHITRDIHDAVDHIIRFYRNYHSSRYVGDDLVIRLQHPIHQRDVDRLSEEFSMLLAEGRMHLRGPYDEETEFRSLPRLAFAHTRHRIGLVRALIDRINECDPVTEERPKDEQQRHPYPQTP